MEFDFKNYKTAVGKAQGGIIMFLSVYVGLILLNIGLIFLTFYGGYLLLAIDEFRVPLVFPVFLGIMGVLLIVTLVQFIATGQKLDTSRWLKVTEKHQPELFQLIREVVKEVGTQMPRKVYLTDEVNAAAMPDSRLISLIIPHKKDLIIGLGLVSATTRQELKAILAHEFGHFSQKSMRIGSFVYHANMVIYKVLNGSNTSDRFVEFFSWMTWAGPVAGMLLRGIKSVYHRILLSIYKTINIRSHALSREMEFHADHVAAKVAGGDQLADALLRLSFANQVWDTTLGYYASRELKSTQNVYPDLFACAELMRKRFLLPEKNGFARMDLKHQDMYARGSVEVNVEWSTHPPVKERVARVSDIKVAYDAKGDEPAWTIFRHAENVQKLMTKVLFSQRTKPKQAEWEMTSPESVAAEMDRRFLPNHADWGIAYLVLPLDAFDPETAEGDSVPKGTPLREITAGLDEQSMRWKGLLADIELLNFLAHAKHDIKEFQHEGKPQPIAAAQRLLELKKAELTEVETHVTESQRKVFNWMCAHASDPNRIFALQVKLHNVVAKIDSTKETLNTLIKEFNKILETTSSLVKRDAWDAMNKAEIKLKAALREWLESIPADEIAQYLDLSTMRNYLETDLKYFDGTQLNETNLNKLNVSISAINEFLSDQRHFAERDLLLGYKEVMDSTMSN